MSEEATPHCSTCICGRRAPVQRSPWDRENHRPGRGPGTISWAEHCLAWSGYASQYPGQSAERMAQRGGFSYEELITFLGHEPKTWEPR